MIYYNGKGYKTRTLLVTSKETGEIDIILAEEELWEALSKDNKDFDINSEENVIDESIYFYVETGALQLPAEEICINHLDEEFVFLEEF